MNPNVLLVFGSNQVGEIDASLLAAEGLEASTNKPSDLWEPGQDILHSVPVGATHWHTYLLIGANKDVCITEQAVLFDPPLKTQHKNIGEVQFSDCS